MPCKPLVNDNDGNIVGFVCNIGGHHARDGKLYLWPLDLRLKTIDEPVKAWDAGDCGQWEHKVECPKCGNEATALEGYMFWYDQSSVKCDSCGFFLDTQLKQQIDRRKRVKKILNVLKGTKYVKRDTTDEQAEQFDKLCEEVYQKALEMRLYFLDFADIIKAFELLAVYRAKETRRIRDKMYRNVPDRE